MTGRRPPGAGGSRPAVRGSRVPATAGRSPSGTPAGWPAPPDAGPDGTSQHPGDVAAQARAVFAIIERALGEAGFALAEIVRTRMYITDPADAEALLAVHGALFGEIRPVATLIVVAGLLHPSLLVEIEAEAHRGSARARAATRSRRPKPAPRRPAAPPPSPNFRPSRVVNLVQALAAITLRPSRVVTGAQEDGPDPGSSSPRSVSRIHTGTQAEDDRAARRRTLLASATARRAPRPRWPGSRRSGS